MDPDQGFDCDAKCGEKFDRADIWHCPKCDHHWPSWFGLWYHRDECWNCNDYIRKEATDAA